MLLNILLGLLIVDAIAMTGLVLLQRSEGGALGIGGGGGQLISARGAGNILTKGTQILAAVFFILALTITVLTGRQAGGLSVTDQVEVEALTPEGLRQRQLELQQQQQPVQPLPTTPGASPFQAPEPTIDLGLDPGAPTPPPAP